MDSVYDGSRDNLLNLEVIRIFIYTMYMYNTVEWSEPEKIHKNKIKTTFGPPILPIKIPHKTPTLTNLRGGKGGWGPDPAPLWIRVC